MSGLVEDINFSNDVYVIEEKDTVDSDMGFIYVPDLYFIYICFFCWGEMSSPNFGLFMF